MKHLSLREKLIFYFLFLGLGAILITSFYSFFSTRNALITRTFDQLTSLRLAKQNQVERFFQDRVKDITLLSHSSEITEIVHSLQKGNTHDDRKIALYLKKFSVFRSNFECIFFLGTDDRYLSICTGDSVASPEAMKNLPATIKGYLPSMDSGIVIHDIILDDHTGIPRMYISAPVIGRGRISIGSIVMEIRLKTINEIMLSKYPNPGFGETGETYLVGSDYLMRSSSRFIPNSVLHTMVKTEPAINAFRGMDNPVISRDYRNIPVLSSSGRISIPGPSWAILAEIEQQEAMVPVIKIRNNLFILSTLISLLFIIAVFLISKMITRPIVSLKYAAVKVGQGNYDINLPVTTHDEIGALTMAFNLMSSQIKEKTEDLKYEKILRLRTVIDAEEAERLRLSREIHDGIGQSLVALKLKLESLLYMDEKLIKENIIILKEQFDTTVDEVRRISNNLMPSVLQVFGITVALRNLCKDTENQTGLIVDYAVNGDPEKINPKIKTYLYRIAQEAVNNTVRHAEATKIEMKLSVEDDLIGFTIRDNGKGFIRMKNTAEKGNGLHNMRERVSLLHGNLIIKSVPGKGTSITIKIPVF
ncbi:MAG TPA: ATP-binding protein [Bacteroidales bacterium]|nr:ATP-binding protein [Bacteroidales bacterium]